MFDFVFLDMGYCLELIFIDWQLWPFFNPFSSLVFQISAILWWIYPVRLLSLMYFAVFLRKVLL